MSPYAARLGKARLLAGATSIAGGGAFGHGRGSVCHWGAIAAVLGVLGVFGFGLWEFALQPCLRRRKLRRPCKAFFLISAMDQCSHAVQDDKPHYVEELTLPEEEEVQIDILYIPNLDFTYSQIFFGCGKQNNENLTTKPVINTLANRFIKRGDPEESPEKNPETQYVDEHEFYHVTKSKAVAKGAVYRFGFKIQTRKIGRYEFSICFLSEEEGYHENKLFIRVEKNPSTKMKCVRKEHRWDACCIQPTFKHV
jgi:hypothetical protein